VGRVVLVSEEQQEPAKRSERIFAVDGEHALPCVQIEQNNADGSWGPQRRGDDAGEFCNHQIPAGRDPNPRTR